MHSHVPQGVPRKVQRSTMYVGSVPVLHMPPTSSPPHVDALIPQESRGGAQYYTYPV